MVLVVEGRLPVDAIFPGSQSSGLRKTGVLQALPQGSKQLDGGPSADDLNTALPHVVCYTTINPGILVCKGMQDLYDQRHVYTLGPMEGIDSHGWSFRA